MKGSVAETVSVWGGGWLLPTGAFAPPACPHLCRAALSRQDVLRPSHHLLPWAAVASFNAAVWRIGCLGLLLFAV